MTVAGLDDRMSPGEFAQWKALYDLERREPAWTRSEDLLATLVDEVAAGFLRLLHMQAGKQVQVPSRPTQIKRTTEEQDSRRDAARAMQIFQSLGKGV